MNSHISKHIYTLVRNSFFNIVNKEFLIFLFFLALSATFWFLLALNDTYEKEIKVPIRIVNVPKNVVLTSESDDTVRIVVRDKGYMVFAYLYGDLVRPVDINFSSYMKGNGTGVVSQAELIKIMHQELYSSTKLISVKPDRFEFFYNYGRHKRVPVNMCGEINPEASYYIANVEFSPKYVDVYGSKHKLDSIENVMTERINIRNLKDTVVREINLKKIQGVKILPSSVRISVFPDILIEESIEVPVIALNMPEGKVLRTFPSRVKVIFTVGASLFRTIKPEYFKVTADYNDIVDSPSEKCPVKLVTVPSNVKKARVEVQQVDYLIEEL